MNMNPIKKGGLGGAERESWSPPHVELVVLFLLFKNIVQAKEYRINLEICAQDPGVL